MNFTKLSNLTITGFEHLHVDYFYELHLPNEPKVYFKEISKKYRDERLLEMMHGLYSLYDVKKACELLGRPLRAVEFWQNAPIATDNEVFNALAQSGYITYY
jgi:hypothetical protein